MSLSPAEPASNVARGVLHAGIDLVVLSAASLVFACVLTAQLETGQLGWMWPSIPYDYERGDVLMHAVLASLAVTPAMLLIGRLAWVRQSPRWQDVAFAVATLLVIRLGPPDAQVFGNTWTQWEITAGLFLLQWPIILPLTLVAVLLRRLLRWVASRC
jgi:hypothetical protein